MRARTWLLSTSVAIAVLAWYLWPDDESRIRGLVDDAARAAEAEDLDGVMDAIAYDYADSLGLSYLLLKRSLESQLRVMSDIQVDIENMKIEIGDGDTARAELDVRVIATMGHDTGYFVGDFDHPVHFRLLLRKGTSGGWLVYRGAYESAGGPRLPGT